MTTKPSIDYSLYYVTGRDLTPPGMDYLESLEEALKGGVTVVQVREKTADTGRFLHIAKATQEICKKYSVPLIINDRIDIALAINADGVHLGQTDMPLPIAQKLIPPSMILGISVNSTKDAKQILTTANPGRVDYVGIGPVWESNTKKLTAGKHVLTPRGIGEILDEFEGTDIKSVAIGGIKSTNVLRVLHGAVAPKSHRRLHGVAVVSDIAASSEPLKSARTLSRAIKSYFSQTLTPISSLSPRSEPSDILSQAANLLKSIKESTPVVHHITNQVVMNQSANITLAIGASPIMASAVDEMEDMSAIASALLVNYGTIQSIEGMLEAGKCANRNKKPIVFDPVGIGASSLRKNAANELLGTWQAAVIKGNAAEIGFLAGQSEAITRGVDAASELSNPSKIVRLLARKERCVVLMTGKDDYVSDGNVVFKLSNGDPLQGQITGGGCIVGSLVAAFCGAANNTARSGDSDGKIICGDMLLGAIGGVLAITIAAENAAKRDDVRGSGTFLPALIDEIGKLTPESIVQHGRITLVD